MTDEEIMKWAEIVTFGKRMDGTMSVEEAEGYRKSLLNEMAYERKEFKALLANGSIQIIQNWCLIRICGSIAFQTGTSAALENRVDWALGKGGESQTEGE